MVFTIWQDSRQSTEEIVDKIAFEVFAKISAKNEKFPRIGSLTSRPCQALCDLVGCFSTNNGPLWADKAGKVPDAAAIPANVQACQIRVPNPPQEFIASVAVGNPNGLKYAEKSDQEIAEGCNQLIKKSIITWNYLYLTLKITLRRFQSEVRHPASSQ